MLSYVASLIWKKRRNFAVLLLFLIGLHTRCVQLNYPNAVVFDEVHYGSVCRLYANQQFHFDREPPLFRILLCFMLPQEFISQDLWSHVGKEFSSNLNLYYIRLFPAVLGAFLVPLVYSIALKLGISGLGAFLAAYFVAFDNGLIVQSRVMVSDSFHIVLQLLSLYTSLCTSDVCFMISLLFTGLAISTSTSCFATWLVIICLACLRAWNACLDIRVSLTKALLRGLAYVLFSLFVPLIVYFSTVMLHVSLTSYSGPHDPMMSSAFQASLHGGLERGDHVVRFGSLVRLRATGDVPPFGLCYLASSPQTYPVRYEDGRGSSGQQVVVCCPRSGPGAVWEVRPPIPGLAGGEVVRHDDVITLVHAGTGRLLNTHDVAAATSKHKQEVSCFVDHNISAPTNFEWKFVKRDSDTVWKNLHSHIVLQHLETGALLGIGAAGIPDWGRGCSEVVGDSHSDLESQTTVWNAEVVKGRSESQARQLNIFEMTWEYLMKSSQISEVEDRGHRFASDWMEWPLAQSNIAYWRDGRTKAQLHFTGNVVSWSGGVVLSLLLLLYFLVVIIFQRMRFYIIPRQKIKRLQFTLLLLVGAWTLYISQFALTDRKPLFMYQYLYAAVVIHILQSCAIELLCWHAGYIAFFITFSYTIAVLVCYWKLRPLTYAFPHQTRLDLEKLQMWKSWEFIF